MNKIRVSAGLAVVVGIGMLYWGIKLSNQKDPADQTDREFILGYALTIGGGLIALIAAFGGGRASRK